MFAPLISWNPLEQSLRWARGSSSIWRLMWSPKAISSRKLSGEASIFVDEWRRPKCRKVRSVGALRHGNEAAMIATITSSPHNMSVLVCDQAIFRSWNCVKIVRNLNTPKTEAKRPAAMRQPMRIFSLIRRCIFTMKARGINDKMRSEAILKAPKRQQQTHQSGFLLSPLYVYANTSICHGSKHTASRLGSHAALNGRQ